MDAPAHNPCLPSATGCVIGSVVLWVMLVSVFAVAALGAQGRSKSRTKRGHDLRDRITLTNGKVIRGRVVSCFFTDEVLVVQGGSRKRIKRKNVRDVHTVSDELTVFFAMREKAGELRKRREILIEWADSHGLPGMARLQALDVLRTFPESALARTFLGHKRRGKGEKAYWLWPSGERFLKRAQLDARLAKWGTSRSLRAEHFTLKTTAGLDAAVDILFDLERFYLFYRETFGAALQTREVLEPIRVQVWGSLSDFPAMSALPIAYYDLRGDVCSSYFAADAERPEDLFAICTQALLYHTLVGGRSRDGNHLCAWAEIGLGQWNEDAFGGAPGRAAPRTKAQLDTRVASAIGMAQPQLKHLTHWSYLLFHKMSRHSVLRWSSARALAHFLMSDKPDPKRRARFMKFLISAFKKGMGDSSRAFDRAMGETIETLQPKFVRWLKVRRG